jgi:hypothetical protein
LRKKIFYAYLGPLQRDVAVRLLVNKSGLELIEHKNQNLMLFAMNQLNLSAQM